MPRLLLKLALLITLLFTVLCLAFRIPRSIQPSNPVLRGFNEGCEDKLQPCWYGIVPGVTKFDDVLTMFDAIPDWEHASVEKSSMASSFVWRITNSNFTDCTVIIDQKEKPLDLVGSIDFGDCSHVLLGDLAYFIEYPGIIDRNCLFPDSLTYRLIAISTVDNLEFRRENVVKRFMLFWPRNKGDWLRLLNQTVQNNAGGAGWTKEFRYARIGVVESGCG